MTSAVYDTQHSAVEGLIFYFFFDNNDQEREASARENPTQDKFCARFDQNKETVHRYAVTKTIRHVTDHW